MDSSDFGVMPSLYEPSGLVGEEFPPLIEYCLVVVTARRPSTNRQDGLREEFLSAGRSSALMRPQPHHSPQERRWSAPTPAACANESCRTTLPPARATDSPSSGTTRRLVFHSHCNSHRNTRSHAYHHHAGFVFERNDIPHSLLFSHRLSHRQTHLLPQPLPAHPFTPQCSRSPSSPR